MENDILTHPLIEKLLSKRGIVTQEDRKEFFSPDYERHLHSPFLFSEMSVITQRVSRALSRRERIGIFGDFDADGVTGSALLYEGLHMLGLQTFVYIPDKNLEGHGVSISGMQYFLENGVSLVFTVDCGISNRDEIAWARDRGIDVIVIDHHHIPSKLPSSIATINPKMPKSGYPFSDLCGAGTAFKVLQGIYKKILPEKEDQLKWLLDLVAIGTVADCMPIVGENRVLVKYGLIVLSKTRRLGLRELFSVGNIRAGEDVLPGSETIGFSIAPRINAAGRMAHASIAHELLVTKDPNRARELACELERHNRNRQKITAQITEEVRLAAKEKFSDRNCILFSESHYPLGIVGLVAGRIADEFKKPTGILTKGEQESRGSFRSIPEVNIILAIESCKDILVRFGGHEQAAGMIIRNENLDIFYERFHKKISEMLSLSEKNERMKDDDIDGEADASLLTVDFARALKQFEPFGIGNKEPLFSIPNALIQEIRFIGIGEKHLKCILEVKDKKGKKRSVEGIGFHFSEKKLFTSGMFVNIVGNVQENVWKGRSCTQILIRKITAAKEGI